MDIITTGDVQQIGPGASLVLCQEKWEEIVQENATATNNLTLNSFLKRSKGLASLLADYNSVIGSLMLASMAIDNDTIAWLDSKGYKLDTSCSKVCQEPQRNNNQEEPYLNLCHLNCHRYCHSLAENNQRRRHIVTKIISKRNEMLRSAAENGGKLPTVEEMIAHISAGIGFEVKDNITLARYNEYKKIIKSKIDAKKNVRN